MNILMIYRMKRYREEIAPRLAEYAGNNITVICEKHVEALGLRYFDKEGAINKIYLVNDLLEGKLDDMKFDYIVGNPPYQEITGETTKPVWDKLIIKFFELLENDGEMSLIHPGSWRFATEKSKGAVREVKHIYQNNQITYAEFNDIRKGYEIFGQGTDFDVMRISKRLPVNEPITVHTKSDGKVNVNISDLNMIPTDNFDLFFKLKASQNEEKVEIINDYSYGSDYRFKHVSTEKDENYIYPVVYTITEKDGVVCFYSNTDQNGHFHIPKLIIKKGATSSLLDLNGDYGMTQFAAAIVDTPENLIRMQKVIDSPNMKTMKLNFVGAVTPVNAFIDGLGTMYKFLKDFRKDWWKEFYTDEMEQELIAKGKLNKDGSIA